MMMMVTQIKVSRLKTTKLTSWLVSLVYKFSLPRNLLTWDITREKDKICRFYYKSPR